MIEKPPKFTQVTDKTTQILFNCDYKDILSKISKEYLYWDKVKYLVPKEIDSVEFWSAIKFSRLGSPLSFGKYCFYLKETNFMQQLLHEFDMNFGGTISSENFISTKNKQYYLLNSIMEEAIASSQMEGAYTTRKVAKEMLRKQTKPIDKSQQMIFNNYKTIRFLTEHKDDDLSIELLLEVHKMISENTLEDSKDEGKFRTDDTIIVANSITGEISHVTPCFTDIEELINEICLFANSNEEFIHPIIKAIILHFMISFLHPFVDGNGRTARSLFYWYMLKNGYWLTEFLSISRIIYKSKARYENAFLYTEQDNFDLGYFIQYNLTVLKKAFIELQDYLERKSKEESDLLEFRNISVINERQAHIIKICVEKPNTVFVSKDLQLRFNVSTKTIRSDLEGLVTLHLMEKVPLNKRLVGYTRSKDFEKQLRNIKA